MKLFKNPKIFFKKRPIDLQSIFYLEGQLTGVIKSTLFAGFWICHKNSLVKLWNLGKVSVGVKPEYFSMEMVLRTNLGPLHLLDSLIQDDSKNSYLRKEARISQIVSKDIHKSASIASFQKKNEEKSRFPTTFWLSPSTKKS